MDVNVLMLNRFIIRKNVYLKKSKAIAINIRFDFEIFMTFKFSKRKQNTKVKYFYHVKLTIKSSEVKFLRIRVSYNCPSF